MSYTDMFFGLTDARHAARTQREYMLAKCNLETAQENLLVSKHAVAHAAAHLELLATRVAAGTGATAATGGENGVH